jgi:hypothetical protein
MSKNTTGLLGFGFSDNAILNYPKRFERRQLAQVTIHANVKTPGVIRKTMSTATNFEAH